MNKKAKIMVYSYETNEAKLIEVELNATLKAEFENGEVVEHGVHWDEKEVCFPQEDPEVDAEAEYLESLYNMGKGESELTVVLNGYPQINSVVYAEFDSPLGAARDLGKLLKKAGIDLSGPNI